MTRRTECKKIANLGNSKQMTRRTGRKKIATRKRAAGSGRCRWCSWWCCPGAAGGAAPGSGFSLLRAVWWRPGRPPSPSQPPASRRRPSRAEHGLKLEAYPDRAERGENLRNFRVPGGSRRDFRQTGRRAQIPSQHGISKPDPRAKRRGVLKNTSAVQGGRVLPSGDIKLGFHDARIAPESGAEALQWCWK